MPLRPFGYKDVAGEELSSGQRDKLGDEERQVMGSGDVLTRQGLEPVLEGAKSPDHAG